MKHEQLEFTFDAGAGEYLAPVSALYKEFVFQSLKEFVNVLDRDLLAYNIEILKETFYYSSLYSKVDEKIQQDIAYLFSLSFEELYLIIKNKPLTPEQLRILGSNDIDLPDYTATRINTNTKPKLKLVK